MNKQSILGLLAAILSAGTASAQTVEQLYTGKQIGVVVGSAAGGGYDVIARLVTAHMGKYIPGKPTFVVRNMPGAGGITAANHVANVADKDGTTIGVTNREAVLDPLFSGGGSQAQYDPRKLTWIGTPTQDIGMIMSTTQSGILKIEDAMKREVIAAASGTTSGSAVYARLVNGLIGTKFKVIAGYASSTEARLAMERGEAEARAASGWTGPEPIQMDEMIRQGKMVYILQIGLTRHPTYKDIPTILDFAKGDEERKLMELIFVGQNMGRPFFGAAGIPADRAKALRDAFDATMKDPDFIKGAKDGQIDLDPLTGEGMLKLIEGAYNAPEPLLKKAIEITAAAAK